MFLVFPWLSRSPDFNPMEKIWGTLSRKDYDNNKQFSSANELDVVIERE